MPEPRCEDCWAGASEVKGKLHRAAKTQDPTTGRWVVGREFWLCDPCTVIREHVGAPKPKEPTHPIPLAL